MFLYSGDSGAEPMKYNQSNSSLLILLFYMNSIQGTNFRKNWFPLNPIFLRQIVCKMQIRRR
jgi:hypothetical protein